MQGQLQILEYQLGPLLLQTLPHQGELSESQQQGKQSRKTMHWFLNTSAWKWHKPLLLKFLWPKQVMWLHLTSWRAQVQSCGPEGNEKIKYWWATAVSPHLHYLIDHLIFQRALWGSKIFYSYFTNEENSERLSNLPTVTQLVRNAPLGPPVL